MIYQTRDEHANHYTLVSSLIDHGFIGGVMISVLVSSLVDRGFIGGVMVSVLASSLVDRGFISGVMVRRVRLESGKSWVHRWCNG
jgi:hypothetical protein